MTILCWACIVVWADIKHTHHNILAEFADNPALQQMTLRLHNEYKINLSKEPLLKKAIFKDRGDSNSPSYFSPSLTYRTRNYPEEILDVSQNKMIFSIESNKSYNGGSTTSMFLDETETYFFITKFYDDDEWEEVFFGKVGTDLLLKLGVTPFKPGNGFALFF